MLLASLSPKISPQFSLRPAVFELQTILRHVHWTTPEWPWTLQHVHVQGHYKVLLISRCPKLQSLLLYRDPFLFFFFWVTDHFETSALNDPKSPWALRGQIHPHKCVTAPESQISLRFALQPPRVPAIYLSYRPCWKKCTECPQNDLANVPHICSISVPESQISLSFALWPAFFKLQAILRKVHKRTQKWHWTLQGQMYPIYVVLMSLSLEFHSVSLY